MKIDYSKQAIKFINKQDSSTKKRLIHAINTLPDGDVKKLQGKEGYRLRIGDFRVLFDKDGKVIYIRRIGNRGQIYND